MSLWLKGLTGAYKLLSKYPAAREMLETYMLKEAQHTAWVEKNVLLGSGLAKLKPEHYQLFVKAAESRAVTGIAEVDNAVTKVRELGDYMFNKSAGRTVLMETFKETESGGLKRISTVRKVEGIKNMGYYPHVLPGQKAERMSVEADKIFDTARSYGANIGETPKQIIKLQASKLDEASAALLDKAVENSMATGKLSEEMRKSILYLTTQKKMTGTQAIKVINDRVKGQLYGAHDMLRYARENTLPFELYEKDPLKAWMTYGKSWAKHMAQVDAFGDNYGNWVETLRGLDGKAGEAFERLTSFLTGKGGVQVPLGWKNFSKRFAQYESAAKIGLGTAVIPNLFQTVYSTWVKVGTIPYLKGIAKLISKDQGELLQKSGINQLGHSSLLLFAADVRAAPFWSNMRAMNRLRYDGMKWYEKYLSLSSDFVMTPFNAVNRMNNAISGSVGDVYAQGLWRQAGRGSKRAVAELQKLGLEYRTGQALTLDMRMQAIYRFARDTQLQHNVLADPLWMNDPRFKVLSLFKRFGFRQAQWVKNEVFKEVGKGNVAPLLRLIASGAGTGYFIKWAKDAYKRGLGNDPNTWEEDDFAIFNNAIDFVSASGSMGTITDLVRGVHIGDKPSESVEKTLGNMVFSFTPVLVSEVAGTQGTYGQPGWPALMMKLAKIAGQEDDLSGFVKESVPEIAGKISPLGGNWAAGQRKKKKEHERIRKIITSYKRGW